MAYTPLGGYVGFPHCSGRPLFVRMSAGSELRLVVKDGGGEHDDRRWSLLAFVTVLAMSGTTKAEYIKGESLVESCNRNNIKCTFYLLGVVDTLNEDYFCIPKDITPLQLGKVFSGYAAINKIDMPASDLVINAFSKVFPCGK